MRYIKFTDAQAFNHLKYWGSNPDFDPYLFTYQLKGWRHLEWKAEDCEEAMASISQDEPLAWCEYKTDVGWET